VIISLFCCTESVHGINLFKTYDFHALFGCCLLLLLLRPLLLLLLLVCVATDSPHLAKSAFALALSPMLWAQHKPDRFDSWSAGIVMMQLCLPGLRTPRGLNLFKVEYERADYDLEAWRSNCRWIT